MANTIPLGALVQGGVHRIVRDGFRHVTAREMELILKECSYKKQRPLDQTHINVLADVMKRRLWRPRDPMDFARIGNRFVLVNGYHRGHAQIASGESIEWTFIIHECSSWEDVGKLYYTFDTNVRRRSAPQILHGSNFADSTDLSKTMANAVFSAVPFIASGFSTSKKDQDILVNRVMDRRIEVALSLREEAKVYDECLSEASSVVKKKLIVGGITAVALMTIRYQKETAIEFWSGAAKNDGLRRGDPRHTFVQAILTRHLMKGLAHAAPYFAAKAWNAWYQGHSCKLLRVQDVGRIQILGTPFDGSRR